jgi:hypothetical protein
MMSAPTRPSGFQVVRAGRRVELRAERFQSQKVGVVAAPADDVAAWRSESRALEPRDERRGE